MVSNGFIIQCLEHKYLKNSSRSITFSVNYDALSRNLNKRTMEMQSDYDFMVICLIPLFTSFHAVTTADLVS